MAFFSGKATNDELTLSDELINEITISDELIITCPMYNFQIPSSLKAYFDHVVELIGPFSIPTETMLDFSKTRSATS